MATKIRNPQITLDECIWGCKNNNNQSNPNVLTISSLIWLRLENISVCKRARHLFRSCIVSTSLSISDSSSLSFNIFSEVSIGNVEAINCPKYKMSICLGCPFNNILNKENRMCLVVGCLISGMINKSLWTSCKSLIMYVLLFFSFDSAANSYKCSKWDLSNSPGASCHISMSHKRS